MQHEILVVHIASHYRSECWHSSMLPLGHSGLNKKQIKKNKQKIKHFRLKQLFKTQVVNYNYKRRDFLQMALWVSVGWFECQVTV